MRAAVALPTTPSRGREPVPGTEAGMTLIELLVAIVILGLAVVAMVGGITTLASTSGLHRDQADVSSVVESAAESIKIAAYASPCGTYTAALPVNAPGDVSPTITVVTTYWNGIGFQPSCPGSGDQGLQQVQITARTTDGSVSQSLYVVKANRT